eukprot:8282781-Heterocapsa_arctica.AAC.1
MVEASRPRSAASELFQSPTREATYELVKLVGWDQPVDPDAAGINAAAENHRYRLDQDDQWRRTGASAWDGHQNPCSCKAFLHAHFHNIGGRHLEGARCPAAVAIPFWERILAEGQRETVKEDAAAGEAEGKAQETVRQCKEAWRIKEGDCEECLEEAQEAQEEVDRLEEEA